MTPTFLERLSELLHNRILWVPILTWIAVQGWKFVGPLILHRKIDLSQLWAPGGMPSSHAALVASLAMSTGMAAGYDSPSFAVAAVLAFVVMYDAAGIRQAAGKQAHKINQIVEELLSGHALHEEQLRELLGHTPFQVIVGGLIGLLAGWLLNL